MGWRGTLRSINAMSRQIERENQRRQRNAAREYANYLKSVEKEQNRLDVENFEEHLKSLTSIHLECDVEIEWDAIKHQAPIEPQPSKLKERKAIIAQSTYVPSFWDKLFGRIEKKKGFLEAQIIQARDSDNQDYQQEYDNYLKAQGEWKEKDALANLILSGDTKAYQDVVEDMNPFSEIIEMGCRLNYVFYSAQVAEVALTVNGDHIIPDEALSLTASGKKSVKKMPKGRFNELYQDYVCSCTLYVGRELTAILPLNTVLVNANAEMLNPQTGNIEATPVLGVAMVKNTLKRLNFSALDPSESMKNFICRMGFKKSEGFQPIEVLKVSDCRIYK